MTTPFWKYWFYDEDLGQWTKQDETDNFEWRVSSPIKDIPTSFLTLWNHHTYKEAIIQCGWKIVKNLPVDEKEAGKQEWVHEAMCIDLEDPNLITVVFYEKRFDIYRELHIQLIRKQTTYVYVNLGFKYL